MNVTDQWMLERMQQMAASMAAPVPQTSQDEPKAESFQDMMNKAKDQKVEAPKKAEPTKKTEAVEKTAPRKVTVTKNADGTETKSVQLTAQEAAAVAAGYAQLAPVLPDGTVPLLIVVGAGEDGKPNPLMRQMLLEQANTNVSRDLSAVLVDGQWVVEPSEELETALIQFLEEAGDSRSADSIMEVLNAKFQEVQERVETKVTVRTPEMEQTDGDEDEVNLDAQAAEAKPLFKDVKAAPMKVGDNFQLDTEEADMDRQLADTIQFAAQQGLKQIEIKLSPENLGNLTIKLIQASDGTLQVILHAANSKAANLLNQHLDHLNAALQGYSQNSEVQVQVQRNEDSQQAQQQQYQQADPDGRNRQQQQQQQHRQDNSRSEDFIHRLRLGLFGPDDTL